MALSYFCDKYARPSEDEVNDILGREAEMWMEIEQYIQNNGLIKEEWKNYTQKAGWCKKILLIGEKDERNIIFLYPNINCITCVFVFGENAVQAAEKEGLPEDILNVILSAKPYREGRSFNIEVKEEKDLIILKKLIDIKIQN